MVLRANTNTPATEQPAEPKASVTPVAAAFEPMDEGTDAANEAPWVAPAQAAAPAQPAPAPAPAANVPAVVQGGTVAVADAAPSFQNQVFEMKGSISFAHGTFKVVKGVNGEIASTDGQVKLGRWAHGTMVAWDDHWEISPGSKSEKSKEAAAYSKDGSTISHVIGRDKYGHWVGKPIQQYVDFLKNEGDYPNAKVGRYVDIAFLVDQSETGDEVGEILQVTLAPSSISSFDSYQEKLKAKALLLKRGVKVPVPADPFTFYLVREAASFNGNNWTKINVMDKLPAKL